MMNMKWKYTRKRIGNCAGSVAKYLVLCTVLCFLFMPVYVSAANAVKVKVTESKTDKNPIPDKYNTGCKGELRKVAGLQKIEITGSSKTSEFAIREGSTNIVLHFQLLNQDVEGKVYIDDYDFSDKQVSVYNTDTDGLREAVDRDITLVFRNCRFGVINRLPYDSRLQMEFEHCSLNQYRGSNAKFTRCAIGGTFEDGLEIQRNVTVTDCYFSDYNKANTDGTHTDGIHIFGNMKHPVEVKDLIIQGCRFEIPQLQLEGNVGYVNSCFSLAMEYGDANNVQLIDNILNGGGYTIYSGVKPGYENGKNGSFKVSDILLEHNRIGDAGTQWGAVYPIISEGVTIKDLARIDALYIGSVWKDETGIHLSVSNDTRQERVLKIVTDRGVFTKTIPACPCGKLNPYGEDIEKVASFSLLPFDLVVTVPKNSRYVVCLDATDEKTVRQIRFVNYSGEDVYISEKLLGGKQNLKDPVLLTGQCGEQISFTLTKDYVLTLTGSGAMYEYSPKKDEKNNPYPSYTPWVEYLRNIRKVVISDGVTTVGKQAFSGCYALEEVELADSVKKINTAAFEECANLKKISMPGDITVGENAFVGTQIR